MSASADVQVSRELAFSVDSSLAMKLLPTVLSLVAGSFDIISFLGLGGLSVQPDRAGYR